MRVGIFSECYEPVQNGVSTSVRTLVEELRARHHRVLLVTPEFPGHEDDSPFILRVPSLLTPFNADYPLPYPWFPRLRRDFGKVEPDVLHSHSPFFLGLLAARLARQDDIPLVSTYHTLYDHYGHYLFFLPPMAIQGLLEWWLPEYYNRCACVIVPSRVAEASLRRYKVTSDIEVIPTAVPLPSAEDLAPEAQRQARERWGIPLDAPLVLYAGRLALEKNVELVLDSFNTVAAQMPDARLLVVGGGPHLAACEKHAQELEAGARIRFAGPVPRNELDPVFATADLFAFASTTETQGLVIAEARAAGTPAVVVDEGGAAETVRHGDDGIVVKANHAEFSEALGSLLGDRARLAEMSAQCLRNATRYTPAAMADRVLQVYERAICRHAAADMATS